MGPVSEKLIDHFSLLNKETYSTRMAGVQSLLTKALLHTLLDRDATRLSLHIMNSSALSLQDLDSRPQMRNKLWFFVFL